MNQYVPVTRIKNISCSDFRKTYVNRSIPVVITDIMSDWKALKKWSFEFFGNLNYSHPLHIEIGNILQDQTAFEKQTIGNYIEKEIVDSNIGHSENKPYLSSFNIFHSFPDLEKDIDFSLLTSFNIKNIALIWIGPSGTITGFHTDWVDNLVAQIRGRKNFLLVSPDYNFQMYPSSKYDSRSKLSLINFKNYSSEQYPLFQEVKIFDATLNPGEMLFIPQGWWHHVEALEASITVNNFGLSIRDLLINESSEKIKAFLHEIGLFAYGNCTCHMHDKGIRILSRDELR